MPLHEMKTRSRAWKVQMRPLRWAPEAVVLPALRGPALVATPLQGVALQLWPKIDPREPTLNSSQQYTRHTDTLRLRNSQCRQRAKDAVKPHAAKHHPAAFSLVYAVLAGGSPPGWRQKDHSLSCMKQLHSKVASSRGQLGPACAIFPGRSVHAPPYPHHTQTPSVALVGGLHFCKQLGSWLPWKGVGPGEASQPPGQEPGTHSLASAGE